MALSYLDPITRALDDNALPLSGAKLRFYNPGTTTPRTVYTDAALTIAHSQPVLSDAAGNFPRVYLSPGSYKRTLHTAADVLRSSEDNIDPGLGLGTSVLGLLVAEGPATVRTALSVPSASVTDGLDSRVTDMETVLAAPLLTPATADTFAASYTPVFTAEQVRTVTLTGNITINAPTVTAGQRVTLILKQDGTGGRTATWNTAYKFPGGTPPALSRAANAVDVFDGYVNGASEIQMLPPKIQGPGPSAVPDAIIVDRKASGTTAGASTIGSDVTRDLQTITYDRLGVISVSGNQVLINQPGSYFFEWEAPAYGGGGHQSMLYDVTGGAILERGTSEATGQSGSAIVTTWSRGSFVHTFSGASNVYAVRHRFESANANGMGKAASFGSETYTRVKIWRIA